MTPPDAADAEIPAPLALHSGTVLPEWIDYNGHMNVAYYVLAFDHATDRFFDFVGLDTAYRTGAQATTFAVEAHVTYLRELHQGDPIRCTTQLLGYDEKRFHYFHRMYHADEGYIAATAEWLSLHIDLTMRRVAPMPARILDRFAAVLEAHSRLPPPEQVGHVIKVASKRSG